MVGKPDGRRPLGRPRHRWKDGVRIALEDIVGGVECIQVAQDMDRWRVLFKAVINVGILAPRSEL
jgi:hypothetical protein